MIVYRAISKAEWDDLRHSGRFRPGHPSYQGKWVMPRLNHAVAIGKILYQFEGIPFHLVEIELMGDDMSELFLDAFRDRIGPAYYLNVDQLDRLRLIREIVDIPLGDR